jgi:hypothetical protein
MLDCPTPVTDRQLKELHLVSAAAKPTAAQGG